MDQRHVFFVALTPNRAAQVQGEINFPWPYYAATHLAPVSMHSEKSIGKLFIYNKYVTKLC